VLRLPPIELRSPTTVQEAVKEIAQGNVRLVAGGTDLWPNMKRRHQKAEIVISLMSIPGLDKIDSTGTDIHIGGTATLSNIIRDDKIRERFPAFAKALASISSPPLRNMGTIGGNLCVDTRCTYYNQTEEWRRSIDYCLKEEGTICWVATKSPRCWAHTASDSAPILCALDAKVKLVSASGEREIPLTDMYVDDGIDYLSKQPDEILTEVTVPGLSDSSHGRSAFWKLRRRGSIDFSTMSVAAAVWMDDDVVTRASMYLGAVGSSTGRQQTQRRSDRRNRPCCTQDRATDGQHRLRGILAWQDDRTIRNRRTQGNRRPATAAHATAAHAQSCLSPES
jgi:4-hydroxybenzoyl-CoA reductase subunit beta